MLVWVSQGAEDSTSGSLVGRGKAADGSGELDPWAYVASLAVDPHWREQGVARELVRRMINEALEEGASCVRAHVHVGNQGAVTFYKKLGFRVAMTCPRYYPRLSPPDAYLVERRIQQAAPGGGHPGADADADADAHADADADTDANLVNPANKRLRTQNR